MDPVTPSYIEIDIDGLAHYMFTTNRQQQKWIQLDLHGIENPKDLFCLCLDLFCKGLVILFGVDNRVYLDDLTLDQFQELATCMNRAGILCRIEFNEDAACAEKSEVLLNSLSRIHTLPDNLPITDYSLTLKVGDNLSHLTFSLFRLPV